MTEEQIEKEADNYAECCNGGSKGNGIIQQSWKAGYKFRDKEVEELKAEIEDLKRRNTSLLDRSGNRY